MIGPPARPLGQRLRAGEQLLGALVRLPAEQLVETIGLAGLDFVLVDTEHGPADLVPLLHHLGLAAAAGLQVLVRLGGLDPAFILRVLDLGAAGIVVPHVISAEQARAAVSAAHYPPAGRRGFATYTRAGRYGLSGADAHRAAAASTVVAVMVESATGVKAATDICATPGVDAVLVGPADLAVDLTCRGVVDVSGAVARSTGVVHRAARASGVAVASIVADPGGATAALAAGAGLVVYNTQLALRDLFAGLAAVRPPVARP